MLNLNIAAGAFALGLLCGAYLSGYPIIERHQPGYADEWYDSATYPQLA